MTGAKNLKLDILWHLLHLKGGYGVNLSDKDNILFPWFQRVYIFIYKIS